MKNKVWIEIAIIVGFIIIFCFFAFRIGSSIPPKTLACTEMACLCQENNENQLPCNTCEVEDLVFASGIINFYKHCSAKEIITCENNIQTGTRIETDEQTCSYRPTFFEFIVEA